MTRIFSFGVKGCCTLTTEEFFLSTYNVTGDPTAIDAVEVDVCFGAVVLFNTKGVMSMLFVTGKFVLGSVYSTIAAFAETFFTVPTTVYAVSVFIVATKYIITIARGINTSTEKIAFMRSQTHPVLPKKLPMLDNQDAGMFNVYHIF